MRNEIETYLLAARGATQGLYKYYLQPTLTAKRAWLGMGLGILAYELSAPPGELLSEGVDKALESHKVFTLGAIALVAAHLANAIPERYDPLHRLIF